MRLFQSTAVRRWVTVAALPLMLAPTILAAGDSLDNATKERVLERMGTLITKYAYVPGVDFDKKWPEFLEGQKEAIDKAESEAGFSAAVNGALAKFGFSHINLITPQAAKQRREGKSVGIGVSLMPRDDGFLVIRVVPKSPADEGKILPGDTLVEANGKAIKQFTDLLGGDGEPVMLKVKNEKGDMREVKLVRRAFSTVRPEELQWLDKDTALVKVHTFDLSYDADNVERIMKEAAGAKKMIIDLRSNGGGVVLNVQHFLGLLLPQGTSAGTFINKRLVESYETQTKGDPNDLTAVAAWSKDKLKVSRNDIPHFKGKIAVLVNGGTGSGAEITAATLREHVGASVIGTKSAGAVLVALMAPLPDGWVLLYPVTDYVTPKGYRIEGKGVLPDVEANDPLIPLPGKPDEVVDKAVAALNNSLIGERAGG
jgi:carboxyl-terminal processing protease